jgi:uncharacterized surface protein with fasciclin (FAS1) repeats
MKMKNQIIHKVPSCNFKALFLMLLGLVMFYSCKDDTIIPEKTSEELVISDYVTAHSDQYSEFGKLLENTGLSNLLSIRGPFTLLLPTNDAFKTYCTEKNVTSVNDFDIEFQKKIVYNHLITTEIQSSDIGLGSLRQVNALDDKIATEFHGSDTYFNKTAKLLKRDIRAANGFIHIIDKVIDIVTMNSYQKIASLPEFSIFTKGLELTGIKDTLEIIEFPYGRKTARTHFTILGVSDSVYNSHGIYSIDDLVKKYTDKPNDVRMLENSFYRYMEYHCLTETYFFSDFPTNNRNSKLYPILSYDNNISLIITDDYKINYNDQTKLYTGFIIEDSNYPCKNGAIHSINGLLEVSQPPAAAFVFEPTSYFDLKQGDYYGKYYMKWFDGQNTFAKIKWEGDYLQYYYKNHNTGKLMNDDCLNMNGFWWIEITTPKIMKGKYKMTGNIWSNWVDYDVYIDGVFSATIKRSDPAETTTLAEVNWTKTEEHKVKLVAVSFGILFWDTLMFTPVN